MPITTPTPEQIAFRPKTFRLPAPGASDPHFGFSRSYYYSGEQRGYWKLIRIRDKGKERGITLIRYDDIAEFVRSRAEEAEAK